MDRRILADFMLARISAEQERLRLAFHEEGGVPSCYIDDLLPPEVVGQIHAAFPEDQSMTLKASIKERKLVTAQMDQHHPLLEEIIYAFQDERIVRLMGKITGLEALEPDVGLYAGGLSAMGQGHYLKPHLDNSHDAGQQRYRVLNLLFYVTPDWQEDFGGNLELWDEGPKGRPRTIASLFNRLAIMATNRHSWHSVSEVMHPGTRCCVSNYYFSAHSPETDDYFHATSFRGRPEEPARDLVMRADNLLRTAVLKTTGTKLYKNPHGYHRAEDDSSRPE